MLPLPQSALSCRLVSWAPWTRREKEIPLRSEMEWKLRVASGEKMKSLKFNYLFSFFLFDENGVFITGGGSVCFLTMWTELFVHVDGLTG